MPRTHALATKHMGEKAAHGHRIRRRDVPHQHMPVRRPNHEIRTREHLTEREVEKLIDAAKGNRRGHRDATMILIAYRHGLRASELVDLRWDQVHLTSAILDVRRKSDILTTHPLTSLELRALRRLKREQDPSSFVFTSQRGEPFSTEGFARMLQRAAKAAGLTSLRVHPHMLRHATGFKLANDGHDTRAIQAWLGHKNRQHVVRYTEMAPNRFLNFWRD
jgi:site-specific recombinase XerD